MISYYCTHIQSENVPPAPARYTKSWNGSYRLAPGFSYVHHYFSSAGNVIPHCLRISSISFMASNERSICGSASSSPRTIFRKSCPDILQENRLSIYSFSSIDFPIVPSGIFTPKLSAIEAPITANVFSSSSLPPSFIFFE